MLGQNWFREIPKLLLIIITNNNSSIFLDQFYPNIYCSLHIIIIVNKQVITNTCWIIEKTKYQKRSYAGGPHLMTTCSATVWTYDDDKLVIPNSQSSSHPDMTLRTHECSLDIQWLLFQYPRVMCHLYYHHLWPSLLDSESKANGDAGRRL